MREGHQGERSLRRTKYPLGQDASVRKADRAGVEDEGEVVQTNQTVPDLVVVEGVALHLGEDRPQRPVRKGGMQPGIDPGIQHPLRLLAVVLLEAIDGEDVQSAFAEHMPVDRASLVIVGDASQFIDALRAKHPNVEVIPISELNLDSAALR